MSGARGISRMCPVCCRYNAMTYSATTRGLMYCRWSNRGLCTLTEEAVANPAAQEQARILMRSSSVTEAAAAR